MDMQSSSTMNHGQTHSSIHKHIVKVFINDESIVFENLNISMPVCDVTSFSFSYRPGHKGSFANQLSFNKETLSKKVKITITEDGDSQPVFTYHGVITGLNYMGNSSETDIQYDVEGKGELEKFNKVPECSSFRDYTFDTFFRKLLPKDLVEINDKEIDAFNTNEADVNKNGFYYTVQYCQTTFDFLRMMAARCGEWVFYNGKKLIVGKKYDSNKHEPIEIRLGEDLDRVYFSNKMYPTTNKYAGFNTYTGKEITTDTSSVAKGESELVAACMQAGNYYNNDNIMDISMASFDGLVDRIKVLNAYAATARAVHISGSSCNPHLNVGEIIKIMDKKGNESAGKYVIVDIQHHCSSHNGYQNSFTAIPADDSKVPPYTNPFLFPQCKLQPGIVKENEDKKGINRIKVQFPWQKEKNEMTPWIPVLSPHGGKGKGFRFLPEKGEEVLVDFRDGNPQLPFVMGAMHTEQNKPEVKHENNDFKCISTNLYCIGIDDGSKTLTVGTKDGKNEIFFDGNKGEITIKAANKITIDAPEIILKAKKEVKVNSEQHINIDAKQTMNIIATDLYTEGRKLNKMGSSVEIQIQSIKAEIKGTGTVNVGAPMIDVKADAMLNLKGNAGVNIN